MLLSPVFINAPADHMSMIEHAAGFFTDDSTLVSSTAHFIRLALESDGRCIVVLTPSHRLAVDELLTQDGYAPQQLVNTNRLVHINAEQALEDLCSDGVIDAHRYVERFGELIRLCAAGGKRVWIVGEIVSLLARQNRAAEMMQVEDLCNELSRSYAFRMLCLYSVDTASRPVIEERAAWLKVAHEACITSL